MKTKLCLLIFLLAAVFARAQTNDLTALLQQGLLEEQANRNLDAAIADYQTLATQFDKDRNIAATAIFRLGECYRAQGKTNEAAAQYQRILKDFSDQQTLATLSRQNLAGMGMPESPMTSSAQQLQIGLLEKQIALAQQNVAAMQESFQVGKATQTEVNTAEQQVVQLQITLAGLNASPATTPISAQSQISSLEESAEIQRIQTMIQNSPDLINAPGEGGRTPLQKAASAGWLKVATYLLDHGANVNAGGGGALTEAVKAGNRAMVELCLSRGADVNSQFNGLTLLHIVAQNGFQAVAEVLLANKADVNALDNQGNTPLRLAALQGQAKIIKMLLVAGANPNIPNKTGKTPLSAVADRRSPEITKLLLDAGANPNVENDAGQTPLSFAAGSGSPETVKLLLAAKADPNGGKLDAPLLAAIHEKDTNSAELLLLAGANPNANVVVDWGIRIGNATYGQHDVTPLWLAVYLKQLSMVQLLLKYKADPNDSQTDRRPLLFSALDSPDILKALLDAGAKADACDETDSINATVFKRTALMMAAAGISSTNQIETLLQHGADANARDNEGRTALHWAACNAPADAIVFVLLLNAKGDPNVRDNYGKTPLDYLKGWAQNNWKGRFDTVAAAPEHAEKLIALLHQHGALDKLPDWDAITVSRLAANFSFAILHKGTNDWNQFTLLEAILNFYESSQSYSVPQGNNTFAGYSLNAMLPFPDLTRVVILRPRHDSTNETRIVVNLLNSTNGIDCAKDVPLEFGDVVEIPEREHSLGENAFGLTSAQFHTLDDYVKGSAKLVAHGQTVELPFYRLGDQAALGVVLKQPAAQKALLSSSDLSRVKVIRRDPKTGKSREWVVDCRQPESRASRLPPELPPISYQWNAGVNNSLPSSDLWLRDGDVIKVPEK